MFSVSNDLIQSCEMFKGMAEWGKLEEHLFSWKKRCSSPRLASTPMYPWDSGGWQRLLCFFLLGDRKTSSKQEVSLLGIQGAFYRALLPGARPLSVCESKVFVRGKQYKLSFSVMLFMHWGKTCEVRSIIVNYCSWPILPFCFQHVAFALYFSPVSMLCRWRYFRLNENRRKFSWQSRKLHVCPSMPGRP